MKVKIWDSRLPVMLGSFDLVVLKFILGSFGTLMYFFQIAVFKNVDSSTHMI